MDMAVTANFNMIRVWGGGYYLPDEFMDYLDSIGMMVWQEFVFACGAYPTDNEFLSLVQEEVR